MRLKEIETRLAEIKEELNTRAAELTDEEITKLETEQIPRCLEISREQAAQEQENQRTNTTLRHTEKRL